jgi:hypothetical protein
MKKLLIKPGLASHPNDQLSGKISGRKGKDNIDADGEYQGLPRDRKPAYATRRKPLKGHRGAAWRGN